MNRKSTGSNEPVTNAMSNCSSVGPVIEVDRSQTSSSKASPSNLLPTATGKFPETSLESLKAAAEFKEGYNWSVNSSNWKAALLALADRHPFQLSLTVRVDEPEALPVAAIVNAVKRCGSREQWPMEAEERWEKERRKAKGIWEVEERKCLCFLESLETFYTATDVAIDKDRLEHILSNPSLHLSSFYGHLDHATIVKLPRNCSLGLAIGCAADSAAISALLPHQLPDVFGVSVTARVAVEELQVLPDAKNYGLYFPFLSDDRVDSVRPSIKALVPNLEIWWLEIPLCQLTSRGFSNLIEQLRGVKVTYRVAIEPSGTWQPTMKEKNSLATELYRAVGCPQVTWGDGKKMFPRDYSSNC